MRYWVVKVCSTLTGAVLQCTSYRTRAEALAWAREARELYAGPSRGRIRVTVVRKGAAKD